MELDEYMKINTKTFYKNASGIVIERYCGQSEQKLRWPRELNVLQLKKTCK